MKKTASVITAACGVALIASACASNAGTTSSASSSPAGAASPTSVTSTTVAANAAAATSTAKTTVGIALPSLSSIIASSTTNQTVGMPSTSLNASALALGGTSKLSQAPKVGYIYACNVPHGGPPVTIPPWIDQSTNTWDATTKVAVRGSVTYPTRTFSAKASGSSLVLSGNGLPQRSGSFPVQVVDPAYQYNPDRDHVTSHTVRVTLPLNPKVASTTTCNTGFAGLMADGIPLLNGYDAGGYDAVAIETEDTCHGHPNSQTGYHYHGLSPCLLTSTARKQATQVGWAFDGFGIYVEYDANGKLLTNKSLDACHGRTSTVTWHGKKQRIYHYDMTAEFPYSVACFRGTPVAASHATGIGYIAAR